MSVAEKESVASNLLVKRAVLYLRVSTQSQVKTDYDPEGISIPAQRLSCERKATQMGVEIVGEYVEPGRSGTNIEHRPVFREMLDRLRTGRDVDYVIVYKLSRLNRNRIDDAKVLMLLRKNKVGLVSATENIDDTPVGQLMHGILASFNEFRSAEDGADIRYKMGQKAKSGGTLGRAPLGYENVIQRFEGRDVRTVALDEARAPLVQKAWELYASGDYSLERLLATISDLGLTTRPTVNRPGGPVSLAKLHQMLRDPYYKGVIVYDGAEYPGRHPKLITSELFDRVQAVLDARAGRGSRDRKHHHYLRGMLFCERCHKAGRESRMIYTLARGRSGERWEYYLCRGRQDGVCDLPYLPIALVEGAILAEYGHYEMTEDFAGSVRQQLKTLLADTRLANELARANLSMSLAKLDAAEERLLDLASDGSASTAKIRSRLTRLQQDRERLKASVAATDGQLLLGAELLSSAIDLARDIEDLYRQAPDNSRRLLNNAFYQRFYVEDGDAVGVLNEVFGDLSWASLHYRQLSGRADSSVRQPRKEPVPVGTGSDWSNRDLLLAIARVPGSSNEALVGLGGIEPPTSALSVLDGGLVSRPPPPLTCLFVTARADPKRLVPLPLGTHWARRGSRQPRRWRSCSRPRLPRETDDSALCAQPVQGPRPLCQ